MAMRIYELFNAETINIDLNKQEHVNNKFLKKYSLKEKKEILKKIQVEGELIDLKYKYHTFSRSDTYEDRF